MRRQTFALTKPLSKVVRRPSPGGEGLGAGCIT